jgi:hypothetical protein
VSLFIFSQANVPSQEKLLVVCKKHQSVVHNAFVSGVVSSVLHVISAEIVQELEHIPSPQYLL